VVKAEGLLVGGSVGEEVLGDAVGMVLGVTDNVIVGERVSEAVGSKERMVGDELGFSLGEVLGLITGGSVHNRQSTSFIASRNSVGFMNV